MNTCLILIVMACFCSPRESRTIEFGFEFEFELDFELDFELGFELEFELKLTIKINHTPPKKK